MGSINKFCPHCGSERVHTHGEVKEVVCSGDKKEKYYSPDTYFECQDCNETWEPHN